MGQATKAHIANACLELGVSELLGIGLWGDGVPCKVDRSESLEVLTMNVPGVSTTMRVPVAVINEKIVVKALTFDSIFFSVGMELCSASQWGHAIQGPFGCAIQWQKKHICWQTSSEISAL